MSTQPLKTKVPTVTPDQVSKLLASVFTKFLNPERRDEFYESLRKWDRHENPFINFTRICTNYLISEPEKFTAFIREMNGLTRMNVKMNTLFGELVEKVFEYNCIPVYTQVPSYPCDVVSVRILDILNNENRRNTSTYESFIDIADEYHLLLPCNLFNGFRALKTLIEQEMFGHYFIGIPEPITIKDNQVRIIPRICRRIYNTKNVQVQNYNTTLEPVEIDVVFDPVLFNMSGLRTYTHAFGYIYKDSKIIMLRKKSEPNEK